MYFHWRKRAFILSLAIVALLAVNGCGFRTSHPVKMRTSTAVLREATLEQLVETINANAARIKSLKANPVDIDSSVVELKKDRVKDNPQVSGWVLLRKPEMLRMRVLVPVVRTVMIDMVSDGKKFELSIPPKNKFIVGSNREPAKPSAQPLYNIRPQHIFDALLLKAIDPSDGEIAVLENSTEIVKDPKSHKDVEQANYAVLVIRKDEAGYYLSRKIFFSRTDLLPHEQYIYNRQGQLATYAHYENFSDYSGIMFPGIVSIQRPVEGYGITLSIVKLDVNLPLTDEQFTLAQPPGSQLINLDTQSSAAATHE
jgi:hypothetical protein